MGLIKHRPEIQLRAPRQIHVGSEFEVEVLLDCEAAVECTAIALEQRGVLRTLDSQHQARDHRSYTLRANIAIEGPLEPGTHSYRFRLRIPPGVPPRYQGLGVRMAHTVEVRVDIPWWPDARASFDLGVIESANHAIAREYGDGGVFGSREDGGAEGKAYLELALGTRVMTPGETFETAISLFGTERNRYGSVRMRLLAQERAGGTTFSRECLQWTIPVEDPGEGATIPLRMQIPSSLVPGFDQGTVGMRWLLEASAPLLWGGPKLRVGVDVSRRHDPSESTLAEVGNVRLARVWRAAAEGLGLEADASTMSGRVGDTEVVLVRGEGMSVSVRVEPPDLGIGLTRGGWRDRIGARDEVHGAIAVEALQALAETIGVTAMNDRCAEASDDRAARNPDPLNAYVRAVLEFARAFDRLPHSLDAPAVLAPRVDAFVEMADALDGTLRRSSMAIRGRRAGTPWWVEPRWDGDAMVGLTIGARPEPPIEGRHYLTWNAAEDDAPRSALPLHEDAWRGAIGLEIDADGLRVLVSASVGDVAGGALVDAIRPRLEALLELCRGRSSGGTYR